MLKHINDMGIACNKLAGPYLLDYTCGACAPIVDKLPKLFTYYDCISSINSSNIASTMYHIIWFMSIACFILALIHVTEDGIPCDELTGPYSLAIVGGTPTLDVNIVVICVTYVNIWTYYVTDELK